MLAQLFTAVLTVAFVLSAADAVNSRRRLSAIKKERAAEAARRLIGLTEVDGYGLPNPDDQRWSMGEATFDNRKEKVISIGEVCIRQGAVYVGDGSPMRRSRATKAYAEEVDRFYKNRLVRKVIES